MSKENLAATLRIFYPSARQKPRKDSQEEGEHYQNQSLINIHSVLNCHLQMPSFNRTWDLMRDKEFRPANRAFAGNLRKQKDEGKDTSKSHKPIEEGHMKQIYDDYFIPHWNNDPGCLQHKVYFDIAYFLRK